MNKVAVFTATITNHQAAGMHTDMPVSFGRFWLRSTFRKMEKMKKIAIGALGTILAVLLASVALALVQHWVGGWVSLLLWGMTVSAVGFTLIVLIGTSATLGDAHITPMLLIEAGKKQSRKWVTAAGWSLMLAPLFSTMAIAWDIYQTG